MHLNLRAREFHSHDSWEIIYCTDGSGRFLQINSPPIEYGAKDIIIVAPHLVHSNVSDQTFSNYYLHVENVDIAYDKITKLRDSTNDFLLHTLKQIYLAFNSNMTNKQDILFHLGVVASSCIKSLNDTLHQSPLVKHLKQELENNLSNPNFDMNKMFLKYHPSAEYVRKHFKKETGITPLQYLIKTRLNYSKKLLQLRDDLRLNIAEIANMSGFSDPLYFSRIYKKHFGKSPKYEFPEKIKK